MSPGTVLQEPFEDHRRAGLGEMGYDDRRPSSQGGQHHQGHGHPAKPVPAWSLRRLPLSDGGPVGLLRPQSGSLLVTLGILGLVDLLVG